MKTKHTLAGAALAAAFALNLTAPEAAAYRGSGFALARDIDRIESLTYEIDRALHADYRHTRSFRLLADDSARMITRAHRLSILAERGHAAPLRPMRFGLAELDRTAERMHDTLRAFDRSRRGDGRCVCAMLGELDGLIATAERTIDRMATRFDHEYGAPPSCAAPTTRGREIYSHRHGTSYSYDNGRGFRISINTGRSRH